jgi:hypothetical protein
MSQTPILETRLVHLPLHPETPAQGKSLEALFAGRGYDIASMQAQMRARTQAEASGRTRSRAAKREVLEKRSFKPAVDADWQKSREYGVTGAQPYQVLEQLVTETTRP